MDEAPFLGTIAARTRRTYRNRSCGTGKSSQAFMGGKIHIPACGQPTREILPDVILGLAGDAQVGTLRVQQEDRAEKH